MAGYGAFGRYSIYPARIGDVSFLQISEAHLRPGSRKSEVQVGGALDRAAVINAFAEPTFSLRTADFVGVLSGSNKVDPVTGYSWDTANSQAAALLQFQKRADGGAFTGGSVNAVGSIARGWACVEEISVSQDAVEGAEIQIAGVALSQDGETDPVTWLPAAALTGTPTFSALWYLSKVMVGTSSPAELVGVQSVRIRPGIRFQVKRGGGMTYAVGGAIVQRAPEIVLQLQDPGAWYSMFGANCFGSDLSGLKVNCYFQKGLHGGSRVARTSTVHYSVYAATGDQTPDEMGVSGVENDLGLQVTIRPTGTLAYNAATAIP